MLPPIGREVVKFGIPTIPGVPTTPVTGDDGVVPPYATGFTGWPAKPPLMKLLAQGLMAVPVLLTVLFELA